MIFCQACGSQNADDARFCNMCGTSIAKVGSPGGPIEHTQLGVGLSPDTSPHAASEGQPAYYPGGGNTMSVQLEAIGIRSSKKTWATIAAIALLVFVLGGVATFFTMKGTQPPEGGANAEDPFEVGSPEIQGAEDVDFVSGRREGSMPTPPTPNPTTTTPTGDTPQGVDTSMTTAPATPSTPSTAVASNTTTMSQTTPSTMTTTMDTEPTMDPEPTPTMDPEPTPTMDPEPTETEPPQMELSDYTNRVRYLVRRYYLPRSQSCFEHATRNNPSLHGQVTVSLTIGANGRVTASSVARNSTGDTQLGSCLATQVRTWELTPPPGGEPITMTLPFSR